MTVPLTLCLWTETSSGLQQILQEIQPRDTNDFFTDARELEDDDDDQRQKTHTASLDTGEFFFFNQFISL